MPDRDLPERQCGFTGFDFFMACYLVALLLAVFIGAAMFARCAP